MGDRSEFERAMEQFIESLEVERKELRAHVAHIQAKLTTVEDQLAAARKTLDGYRVKHGIRLPPPRDQEDFRLRYQGLTIREALVRIARENDGLLDVSVASNVLINSGMFSDVRSAGSSIYPTLARSGDIFKKVERGKYRLVDFVEDDCSIKSATANVARVADLQVSDNGR